MSMVGRAARLDSLENFFLLDVFFRSFKAEKIMLNKTPGGAGWDPKLNIVSTRSPNNSAFIRSSPASPLEGLVILQWMQTYQIPPLSRQGT